MIASGIPSYKLVLGKTVTRSTHSGYVNPGTIGDWTIRAFDELKWFGGVALSEYSKDTNGSGILEATGGLVNKIYN